MGDLEGKKRQVGLREDVTNNYFSPCKKCGTTINCNDGNEYAKSKGVNEQDAVMCNKCKSVFVVRFAPAMRLLDDITSKYFTPAEIENIIKQEKKNEKQFYVGCFVVVIIILLVLALWSKFG